MRSACNILIAIQASSDILIQTAHLPYGYMSFKEQLVSFYTCYFINVITVPCMDFSNVMVIFIAVDRLLSSRFPLFYKVVTIRHFNSYLALIVSICLGYSITMKILIYFSLTEDLTLCLIVQSMTGTMAEVWIMCLTGWNIGVVTIYFFISRMFKGSSTEYKKLNKSLNTMIIVYFCGWLFTTVGCSLASVISSDVKVVTTIQTVVGIAANVNLAAPFFIYYFRSTLYRDAFQKLLGIKKQIVEPIVTMSSTHI
ncbi:hypothetical protein L596_020363 [Steinernema carpocapsae]|uniref:G-protein coupled receptors family 1 profile domain-containing protein n=1 Tax=Steinernema carpocapsae TaxID=34508 RepID=A0A4U5MTA1_STECR|nr:hypothetical protein L596_020363 [Steinernema carpocapsae]